LFKACAESLLAILAVVVQQILDDFIRQARIISQAQQLKCFGRFQEHPLVAEPTDGQIVPACVFDSQFLRQVSVNLLCQIS